MRNEHLNQTGAPRTSIAYGEAFGVLLGTPGGWGMALRASLMCLFPLLGLMAVMGWSGEISRRVVLQHPNPVPPLRFGDFGYWIGRGIAPFVTYMVVSFVMGMGANLATLPLVFAGGAAGASGASEDLQMGAVIGFLVIFMLVVFVTSVLSNVMMLVAELTGNVSAVFAFAPLKTFFMQTLGLQFVTTFVVSMAMVVLGGLSVFTLFLGLLIVVPVVLVASSHIRAQIYQVNLGRGGLAMVIEPPTPSPTERQMYGLGA